MGTQPLGKMDSNPVKDILGHQAELRGAANLDVGRCPLGSTGRDRLCLT